MNDKSAVGNTIKQSEIATHVLLREKRGHVVILTLNRPEARNSLSEALLNALTEAMADVAADPMIQVVLLTGASPTFCSGLDLKELTAHRADPDGGRAYYERVVKLCGDVMLAVALCPKPVIAVVHGTAAATGCQLVASCDLAVASETSHFATPGVNMGVFCSTPMVALTRNIGRKRAMEMLLLGGMLPAMHAMEFGLINRVVPDEDVMHEAMRWAGMITSKSPLAIRIGKEAFHRQKDMPLAEAYDFAARVMVENLMIGDAKEGISAFLERRSPHWQGN
jgi:enoyl-CoA hydratase/carnithine racemase